MQTRLYDTGWSDEKKCRGCNREKRHREAQAVPLSVREGSWEPDPKMIVEMVSNGPTRPKEGWKWQSGITAHPFERKQLEEKPRVGPKVGIGKAEKLGEGQLKASETTSPPMALCGESRAGGLLAGGRRWQVDHEEVAPMHEMYETRLRCSAPPRGPS